jgi:hypothetical protein
MNWELFYLICFAVGLVLSVLSFLGGFLHFHIGHHLHLGHFGAHSHVAGTGHAASAGEGSSISPINGFTLIAFLCWFGGTGYLLARYGGFVVPMVLAIATVSGLAGGAVIFWFLARVLLPHEHELTAADTDMTGVVARVSGAIREAGTGEIQFTQDGARRFASARSEGGQPIAKDVEVVVMRYERGVAYVRRWDDLTEDAALNPDQHELTGRDNHAV